MLGSMQLPMFADRDCIPAPIDAEASSSLAVEHPYAGYESLACHASEPPGYGLS